MQHALGQVPILLLPQQNGQSKEIQASDAGAGGRCIVLVFLSPNQECLVIGGGEVKIIPFLILKELELALHETTSVVQPVHVPGHLVSRQPSLNDQGVVFQISVEMCPSLSPAAQ